MYEPNDPSLHLAVCDDEASCRDQIAQWAGEILRQEGLQADIDCFASAQELLDAIEAGASFSLLLLDVMMDGKDGMTLASILRQQGQKTPIIFISSNREMALKGYEVEAARYLAKPLDVQKLREALLYCWRQLGGDRALLLPTASGQHRIQPSAILYAETYGRGIRIVLEGGQLESRMKISELAAMLPGSQYTFCHRTILVNLDFVTSIRYCELELKDGTRLPISKYRLPELRSQLLRHLGR